MYEVIFVAKNDVDVYIPVKELEWRAFGIHVTYRTVYGLNCCVVTTPDGEYDSFIEDGYTGITEFDFYGRKVSVETEEIIDEEGDYTGLFKYHVKMD